MAGFETLFIWLSGAFAAMGITALKDNLDYAAYPFFFFAFAFMFFAKFP